MDEYIACVEKTLGLMDWKTLQPTSPRHVHPLLAKEWIEWLNSFTLEEMKAAGIPKEKRLEIAGFFYQILKAQQEDDYFGLEGSNKIHDEGQIIADCKNNRTLAAS
ncbi:hypothetical protein HZC09_00245 [Candidatus Micrarchaeota archaeon]|nr:hypothetical protein [Candidatus Micrarchaeota archaeon]